MQPFRFDNSYARLPEQFYRDCPPTAVSQPTLISFNTPLARDLGMTMATTDEQALADLFSGNLMPEGAQPIATVYAGHQFGRFNPQLGDGRAILLGEILDASGQRCDIQLKGAGRTPYSRGGDGRSPLGPVLREYLISEAMHALGVPSTRALAAISTGEQVYREEVLPGAVLTRVAASHIRVGTFEYFAAKGDVDSVRELADHVIERHYPDLANHSNPYAALLDAVVDRQVALIAQWMGLGFIHGVMNTDNMLVSGETIDYGPCAFMDAYRAAAVFSSIDTGGRYAYRMQPAIVQWNMARFAETLLPLIDEDEQVAVTRATEVIRSITARYEKAWLERMRLKLGLMQPGDDDGKLIDDLLALMETNQVDFTLLFHSLIDAATGSLNAVPAEALFYHAVPWQQWVSRWHQRLANESVSADERTAAMRRANPMVIPRNHRIQQAIDEATGNDDFSSFERLKLILANPYSVSFEDQQWLSPPAPEEQVCQTFCGT